jgi:hypothetical protein
MWLAREADEQLRAARKQYMLGRHVRGTTRGSVAGHADLVALLKHAFHDAAPALIAQSRALELPNDLLTVLIGRSELYEDVGIAPVNGLRRALELDERRLVVLDPGMVRERRRRRYERQCDHCTSRDR